MRLETTTGTVTAARLIAIGGLTLAGAPGATVAQEPESAWQVHLAAGAMVHPDYEGSDDYEIAPLPYINISYRDRVFIEGTSFGANVFTLKGPGPGDYLRIGPLLNYRMGRDQDDNDALRGLGDVDGAVEIGGFVSYGIRDFSLGVTALQDFSASHDGMTVELKGGYGRRFGDSWGIRAEVAATWADDDYTRSFFGIDARQALRSGYREYSAEAGFKDVGLSMAVDYSLTENWGVTGRVGYTRLLGDAADSPIVDREGSANAFSAGIFIGYRF